MLLVQRDTYMQKNDAGLLPHIQTSKWNIDLNVGAKTITYFEEIVRLNLHGLGIRQWFLRYNTKLEKTKGKNR